MADDQNAPAAATGETTPALSLDDAVATLNEGDERREKEAEPKAEAEEAQPDNAEAEAEEADAEDPPAEEAESPSDEDEPDGEQEPDEEVHGNAKTRLRDGTVVAVADLKKAYGELQELKRQGPELSAQRQEIDKAKADVQQAKKFIEESLPHLQHIAKSAIPPAPEESLWDADPVEALQQQRRHDAAKAKLELIERTQQQLDADRQKAFAAELERERSEHESKLLDKRPDLKDPKKREAFDAAFMKVAQDLGFTKDEASQAYDHRLKAGVVSLAEKAAKWDALQQTKPKAEEKAKDAIPVQKPGRRVQPSERRGVELDDLSKRLSRTGSLDDAAALIGKLNL